VVLSKFEVQGIFSTSAKASAACHSAKFFVARFRIDEELSLKTVVNGRPSWYPTFEVEPDWDAASGTDVAR
jgi:hypothetical protein